ncbi:MAG: hypothetical protein ACE5KH_02375, partial [Candidatus Geothermarchaeales archaeon]
VTAHPNGRWYEKHVWILFFGFGLLLVGPALLHIFVGPVSGFIPVPALTGMSWDELLMDPEKVAAVMIPSRIFGIAALGLGIWLMLIAAFPFRKGERWAWYALWYLPVVVSGFLLLGPRAWLGTSITIVVLVAGLLLSYRNFFPKQ